MSDPVANDIADAVLRAGRKHGLNSAQLMHEMAKLLATMTGTMTRALAERSAEPLTPAMAAKASTLGVSRGVPDEKTTPYFYYFRARDKTYFSHLGSEIKPVTRTGDIPFCVWSPGDTEDEVAALIANTVPNTHELFREVARSPFRLATRPLDESGGLYALYDGETEKLWQFSNPVKRVFPYEHLDPENRSWAPVVEEKLGTALRQALKEA